MKMRVGIKGRVKKIIVCVVIICLLAAVGIGVALGFGKEKEKITVYLWSTTLMEKYAPYIQSQVPEADIVFVVGNNDLNFYEFLDDNGKLPDIMTNRRFSVYDSKDLKDSLMDLSKTEEAASYYDTYLDCYRNGDNSINWLPLCGEVDGIVANKALFDKYDIPLPTDYESFVDACKEFENHGIRGFVSDFVYDYTCLELLQGISISELTSLDGKKWRNKYENPTNGYSELDKEVWPGVFERMENFIKDTNLKPEDVELEYYQVHKMFSDEKVAMIREIGSEFLDNGNNNMKNTVMLPYFGSDNQNWLLTYPSFHVALNKDLEKNEKREKIAKKILSVMISEEGQKYLAQKKDVVSYTKNVHLELDEGLSNLKTSIKSNYLYVRLASEDFFTISKDVVQNMIKKEYSAKKAYKEFDKMLRNHNEVKEENIVRFDKSYDYNFKKKGGNEAASVMANSLRKKYGTDILISPSYNFTSPIFNNSYSEKMLGYMVMPNSCLSFTKEMTGKDIVKLLEISIEDKNMQITTFNTSSLPIISGASMIVKEEDNKLKLDKVLVNDEAIDYNAKYKVTYLDSAVYCEEIAKKIYPKEGIEAFDSNLKLVKDDWIEYIKEGNSLCKPTDYISVK